MPRFSLSLEDRLHLLHLQGIELVVSPPPVCLDLWQRAKADSTFHLGQLFVLSQPLLPFTGGTYNRVTGDIWVLLDAEEPQRTAQWLLHELAHARQRLQDPPESIDADWDQEAATFRQARELALEWGRGDLFSEEALAGELEAIEQYREAHWAACELAGSTQPHLARAMHEAVGLLKLRHQWDAATFEAALHGYADDPALPLAVVGVDRCGLRGSWRLLGDEGTETEALHLPQDEESARLLRWTLADLARDRQSRPSRFVRQRSVADEQIDLAFLRLASQADLGQVVRQTQRALLAYDEEASALARWTVFGSQTEAAGPRLYHLRVDYRTDHRPHPPSAEVWVLAQPERPRDLVAEAAWQLYLGSWRRLSHVQAEPLADGLERLWDTLRYAGTRPVE